VEAFRLENESIISAHVLSLGAIRKKEGERLSPRRMASALLRVLPFLA